MTPGFILFTVVLVLSLVIILIDKEIHAWAAVEV